MWAPMYCVPPMEQVLREQLLVTHAQLSLLFSAPLLMVAVTAIPGGILADRIGAKKAAGIGVILIVAGTVLRGTATDVSSLLAFTFIYGAGFGLSYPNIPKLVSAWTPREKAGTTSGLFNLGLPVGSALVLSLTMPVVFSFTGSYQGVFFIWSIPPIVAAIAWWTLVREPPSSAVRSQIPGSNTREVFGRLIRNKGLWILLVLLLLNEFYMNTMIGWTPALLAEIGVGTQLAGTVTSVIPWAAIPALLLMPRFCDKLGLRKPFIWIPSIILAVVAWAAMNISLPTSWLLMAAIGVAVPTRFIIILTVLVELVPAEYVGTAGGLVFIGYVGGIIGTYSTGRILDTTGTFDSALIILVVISIASLVLAMKLPETGYKARSLKVKHIE
ncbi:CynX/NimT family MFS transporter [Chloroflexota bacterium]